MTLMNGRALLLDDAGVMVLLYRGGNKRIQSDCYELGHYTTERDGICISL